MIHENESPPPLRGAGNHSIPLGWKQEDTGKPPFGDMPETEILSENAADTDKGGSDMHKSIMSENLKTEIAKRMGVYDTVSTRGWGEVSSRDCGKMVRTAIEIAEQSAGSR